MNDVNGNGWTKHEEFVLCGMERLEASVDALKATLARHTEEQNRDFTELRLNIHELKTKIAVWAAIIVAAGTILAPALTDVLASILRR